MVDGLAPLRALTRAASTSMEFVTGRRPSADLSTYRKKASPAVKAGQSFEVSDHGRKAESYETLVQDIKDVNTDLDGTPQALVVHLLSATRLPRLHQLNRSSISPFVVMWAIDHRGRVVGEKATWAPRRETREPVWNCAHDLKLPPMPYKELKRSLLHVELWDHDMLLPPNPIGQVRLGCFNATLQHTHNHHAKYADASLSARRSTCLCSLCSPTCPSPSRSRHHTSASLLPSVRTALSR